MSEAMSDERLEEYDSATKREGNDRLEWDMDNPEALIKCTTEIRRLRESERELLGDLFDSFNQACQCHDQKTADGRFMYDHACLSVNEYNARRLLAAGLIQEDQLARPL